MTGSRIDRTSATLPWYTEPLGWGVAQSFGRWLGPKLRELERRGNVIVTGREAAVEAVRRGDCIIAGNHASVIDDFPTAAIFYPHYLRDSRYFIWSVPDRPILRAFHIPLWAAPLFRCIAIDREDQRATNRGFRRARKILRSGQSIALHVEGGRTFGKANKDRPLFAEGVRRIREIGNGVFKLATGRTLIVPLYIHMPHIEEAGDSRGRDSVTVPRDRLYGRAGGRYLPVEFHFGEPYQLPAQFNRKDRTALEAARLDLQRRILRA